MFALIICRQTFVGAFPLCDAFFRGDRSPANFQVHFKSVEIRNRALVNSQFFELLFHFVFGLEPLRKSGIGIGLLEIVI